MEKSVSENHTIPEAAALLDVTRRTVYNLIDRKQLTAVPPVEPSGYGLSVEPAALRRYQDNRIDMLERELAAARKVRAGLG